MTSSMSHSDTISAAGSIPELLAPVVEVSEADVAVAYVVDRLGRPLAAGLGDLPVEMEHPGRAGPLVEVVYVLGDDSDIEVFLQGCDDAVGLIGLTGLYVPAAGIAVPALDGGHFLHAVLFPHSVRVAEGIDSAFLAHSGSGEYCQFFHIFCPL